MLKLLLKLAFIGCSSNLVAASVDILVNDSDGKPLSDIVVYIESETALNRPARKDKIEIGQINKAFTPYITIIQKNQPVIFNNHDDITHQIFSASRSQHFAFKIRSGEENSTIQFDKAGKISMGCNIHDWMSGYLLVLETPLFTKTNAVGLAHFEVEFNTEFAVNIWHPQMNEIAENTVQNIQSTNNQKLIFNLKTAMTPIEPQESGDDFDFLDDY